MSMQISSILLKVKAISFKLKSAISTIPLKSVIIFFILQLAVLSVAFVVFGVLPVHREVKSISNFLESKPLQDKQELTKSNSELVRKILGSEHHEAFLKSNILLSKSDSISLLIDLKDSLAILTFKGVSLFETKITSISFNKGLKKLPLFLLDSLYSGPFVATEEISSIEKFPIVIKKAPKDTLEANLLNAAPILPRQSDVFYLFAFENSMTVEIVQQEKNIVGSRSSFRNYKKAKSKWFRNRNLNFLVKADQKGYTYQLSIKIPREDARSIYRALPIKPVVVVRY
ncbi:MAG: hypothetical protein PHD06_05775 [Bacteroidales bacterium]|nr:hypothetical protein [Bacteroidales bacterium]MDD4384671.1 hypothetical protein [Bacteroidales bacterium]